MSFVYDLYVDNNLNVSGNAYVEGSLRVKGTTTAVNSINLNVSDRHMYLNNGYTGSAGTTGGVILNSRAIESANLTATSTQFTTPNTITATASIFSPGQTIQITGTTSGINDGIFTIVSHVGTALTVAETVTTQTSSGTLNLISDVIASNGFTTSTTVETLGIASFTSGDLIQITAPGASFSGPLGNLGIFEVASHTGAVLTISTTSDYAQNIFEAETTFPETNSVTELIINKVEISLLQSNSAGVWQTSIGSTSTAVVTNYKSILLAGAGGGGASSSTTLTNNANQIIFDHSESAGEINTAIFNILGPTETTSIYSVQDLGAGVSAANFVMSEGVQTLNGDYIIGSAAGSLIFQDSDQSNNYTIVSGGLTADSNYSLPSLDGSHTFVVSNDTTGQVLLGDGVVGAPSYTFTSDVTTGMYTDGVDSLNFSYGGTSILEVTSNGIIVNGGITSLGNSISSVKSWAGVGAHIITINGVGSENVHTVTGSADASITLPSVGTTESGIKFTIINLLDTSFKLTINVSDTDTIEDEILTTLVLLERNQRITLQYIDSVTNWYIV